MISCIRFYPFAETIEYFKSEHTLLRNIELDNEVTIELSNKNIISTKFITIKGKLDNIHKTRIILQDIEKNNLREVFMNFNNR